MKRLIISVVCLLLAVFLAVFGYCSLRHMSLALETQAEEISTAMENGNPEQLKREISDLLALWEKHEKVLGAFVNHEEMERTEILIQVLEKEANAGDYENLSDELMEIQAYFSHLLDSETPKFKNIF